MSADLGLEIKQDQPFSTLAQEATLALMRTADQVQRRSQELLRAYGLSSTQYNALRILRGAGLEGLPCSEIAARMLTHDPDITRLLDRLERQKHIRRSRDAKDRRVIKVYITAAGNKLLKALDRPVESLIDQTLGQLGKTRLRELISLLKAVREQV